MTPGEERRLLEQYERYLDPPRFSGSEVFRACSDRYSLVRILGKGGMACAFLAIDETSSLRVAFKVPLPEILRDPDQLKRFEREQVAIKELGKHEHLVNYHDAGRHLADVPYVCMEYVAGRTVREKLRKWKQLPQLEALRIGLETCEGLRFIHDCGYTHRDVKPPNLILDCLHGERVTIADYGMAFEASFADDDLSQSPVGTLNYMAPEIHRDFRAHRMSPRVDLFSLGCVIYELLCGVPAFRPDADFRVVVQRVLNEDPVELKDLREGIQPGLADLVMRLLRKNPAERPASAAAVVGELRELEDAVESQLEPLGAEWPRWSSSEIAGRLSEIAYSEFYTPKIGVRRQSSVLLGLARRKQMSRRLHTATQQYAWALRTYLQVLRDNWDVLEQVWEATKDVETAQKALLQEFVLRHDEGEGLPQFRCDVSEAMTALGGIQKEIKHWQAETGGQPTLDDRRRIEEIVRAGYAKMLTMEERFEKDQIFASDLLACEIESIERTPPIVSTSSAEGEIPPNP